MTVRVCIELGCPKLTRKTRCHDHERAKDKARGTSTERGYDYVHQQEREAWLPVVMTGALPCRRCGESLDPSEPFDLGHPDADCPKPKAPEHLACNRATCNRATAGRPA